MVGTNPALQGAWPRAVTDIGAHLAFLHRSPQLGRADYQGLNCGVTLSILSFRLANLHDFWKGFGARVK
jgi:hypothetical protein